jgi:superfamily II DNA or RNA helicase
MEKREVLQEEWKNIFLKAKKGILCVAQRSGKCRVGVNIFKEFENPKILIAYPDNKIQFSWISEFEKCNFINYDVTFTNYASISKYNETYDIIVLDEINNTSERQRIYLNSLIKRNKCVLGLSGTISKETEGELQEIGLNILRRYSVEDAIKDEIIAPYKIFIHTIKLDTLKKEKNSKGRWVSEKNKYDNYTFVIDKNIREKRDVSFLAIHRNRILQNSIAKLNKTLKLLKELQDRRVLVFTGLKKIAENLNIPYFHSTSNNVEVFEDFKAAKIKHMAVVNIGKSGTTFQNLDCIILNSFVGNEEVLEQLVARSQLLDKANKIAEIHIITSSEKAEIKKLNKALINFNKEQIIWK